MGSITPEYVQRLHVPAGQQPVPDQIALARSSRDYLIPVLNRGQVIRLHFLNAAKTQNPPTIWLDVLHKGIKLEFRIPQPEVLGVSNVSASLAGMALGLVIAGFIISYIQALWAAVLLSLVYGFSAQLPGALLVRGWRWARTALGG